MMHVALGGLGTERVDLLSHLHHVESGHTQDLGLATLEQCGAVCARDDRNLGGQRTDVRDAAAVDAELIAQDALANQLLGERAERCSQFLLAAFEVGCNLLENLDLDLVGLVVAFLLAGDCQCGIELFGRSSLDGSKNVVLVRREDRVVTRGLCSLGCKCCLCSAQACDERLGGLEASATMASVGA